MRLTPQRLTALLGHGLNESEAKVYLALLEQPRMAAADIAKVTGVPRSHLYKVLQDLHAQDLVDILLEGSSRTYRARPFGEFLKRRADDLRDQLAEVQVQATTLGEVMRPPESTDAPPEAGEIRLVIGRRTVAREIDDILDAAREEVLVAASDHGADRVARQLAPHWDDWKRAGLSPRVTVVLPREARASLDWNDLPGGGRVELRALEIAHPTLTFIVDGAKVISVHPIPDTAELRTGRDLALFSDDRAFAQTQRDLLLAASRPRS